MAAFEEDVRKLNVRGAILTSLLAALGFVVAFAWRDAIQKTVDLIAPEGESLLYQYFSAFIVTVVAILLAFIILKLNSILESKEKEFKKVLYKSKK